MKRATFEFPSTISPFLHSLLFLSSYQATMSTPDEPTESQQTNLARDLESLGDLFSQLDTANATPAPNTSQPESGREIYCESGLPELEIDGFDHCYGDPGTRTISPNQAVEDVIQEISPTNLSLVPISPARDADGYRLETPVVRDPSPSNLTIGSFNNASDAPLDGFTTRVALARLATETGATPSRAPLGENWDIRVTDKEHIGQATRIFHNYLLIYVPHDLPLGASAAMLSLLVPGGAAAYTWRFRSDNDIRADYMPSSVRFRHPGGQAVILAIYEQVPDQIVFGGSALTVENLKALEKYYRCKWGDYYWDMAYKTAAALSAVYVDPVSADQDLGIGFSCVQQTTTHAGMDLRDHIATEPGPSPWGHSHLSTPFEFWTTVPRCFDTHAIRAFSTILGFTLPTDAWVEWDPANNKVALQYCTNGMIEGYGSRLDRLLHWIASPAHGTPGWLALRAHRMLTSDPFLTLGRRYAIAGSEDNQGQAYQGFRNVFGFNDASKLALPTFEVSRAVCLLAGVHLPQPTFGESHIDFDRLWDWIRVYALRLHIAHTIKLADLEIWPDTLHLRPLEHKKIVQDLPAGLTCLTHISSPSRKHLSAINWQLLESIHYLEADRDGVPYYGYGVDGFWGVNEMCVVEVASKETDYPALDSAVRGLWMAGHSVDTVGRTTEDLQPVLDTNGIVAPFALVPFSCFFRFILPISIVGCCPLPHGSNDPEACCQFCI